jgi:uncharacterized repeat protein (TIGR01451 family)
MKKLTISISLLIAVVFSSAGQNVNITSSFDSSRIYIGDQIKFTITVDKPSNLRLNLPVFKDTLTKNIEIVSGPHTDSSSVQNGRIKIMQKYLITSFDSGLYRVKPVFAEIKNAEGLKRFYSDYSMLEVMRVKIAPPDSASKIFDIIEPYRAPITAGEVLPYLLIAILLGAIIWFAVRYFRKHKKTTEGEVLYIPPDPAHVIAFRELERLKDAGLWQKGEIKKYYTELTEIMRQYLENRFKVYSLELTTAETLEALVKTGFKKDAAYSQIKSVLTGADLVKFAKYKPVPEENESHFQTSWNFVLSTMEKEMEPAAFQDKSNGKEGSL